MGQTVETFESWAMVECFGHSRYAGKVSEQAIGGATFIRIDVPAIEMKEGERLPAFTKLLGPASIFAITPCTQEKALELVRFFRKDALPVFIDAEREPPRYYLGPGDYGFEPDEDGDQWDR